MRRRNAAVAADIMPSTGFPIMELGALGRARYRSFGTPTQPSVAA